MVITASHNPAQWNGIKCIVNDREATGSGSRAPLASEADEIVARFRGEFGRGAQADARAWGCCCAFESEIGVHVSWAVDSFYRIAGREA